MYPEEKKKKGRIIIGKNTLEKKNNTIGYKGLWVLWKLHWEA